MFILRIARDLASLELGGGSVEVVKEFKYLGSFIEAHGRMTEEGSRWVAQASRVFGELSRSVFMTCDLSLETKQLLYQSVVATWCPCVWCRDLENNRYWKGRAVGRTHHHYSIS